MNEALAASFIEMKGIYMQRYGILNSHIAKVLADLGHTDTICISDCGLPVPEGVQKIDLALEFGVPSFEQVVSLITKHMKIEAIHIAKEMKDFNPKGHAFLESTFPCADFEWITTVTMLSKKHQNNASASFELVKHLHMQISSCVPIASLATVRKIIWHTKYNT